MLDDAYVCDEHIVEEYENHPKVLEGMKSGRFVVLKCGDFAVHVYKGHTRDYIVDPCRFCSCYDFLINVLSRRKKSACYHTAGFVIARRKGKLKILSVTPSEFRDIVVEISLFGLSTRLRRYV